MKSVVETKIVFNYAFHTNRRKYEKVFIVIYCDLRVLY